MLAPLDQASARFRFANALARNGELSAARRELLRALEDAPMYDEALELLLEVRRALNENKQEVQTAPAE